MWQRTGAPEAERAAARAARLVTLLATVVFTLVLCRWRPWDLFDRGGFSADFYDEQARSFLRGRLSVRPEVAGIEGFLIDGQTYLYYGPLLSIVRMPFALFGDLFAGRLVRVSMIAGFLALCSGAFQLVRLAQPSTADHTAHTARPVVYMAAVVCSPVLFLSGWVSVYHETELWAAAFAVWAIVGTLRLIGDPRRHDAIVTAVALIAAILTRATVGIGITVGVAIALLVSRAGERERRRNVTRIVWAAGAVGVALHLAVNTARFGSPLSLPAERQVLTLQDPDRAAWFLGNHGSFFGLRFLPTTIVHYLRPDALRFERLLPFIRFGPPATDHGSYPVESATPSSSLTLTATLLLALALIGLVVLVRRRAWAWLALTFGGMLASAPTFAIGFIAQRYLVDMLPMLLVPAAVGAASVRVPTSGAMRRVAAVVVAVLVAFGVWSNIALATWVQNIKEPGFMAWRYQVDDLLFDDPAPGIVLVRPGDPAPRDGVVGLDEQCAGVYVAEQERWVALERAEGGRQLTGHLTLGDHPAGDARTVASGDGWDVVAIRSDGTVAFQLRWNGTTLAGEPLVWTGATEVRIVADPVIPEFVVDLGGQHALFAFDVPPLPMRAGPGLDASAPGGESLCRQLMARR